jgi:hypothetical protein
MSDPHAFISLQSQFTQSIQETPHSFLVYSTRNKKFETINKINVIDKGNDKNIKAVNEDIFANDRDVLTKKQRESKLDTALPFEKKSKLLRFGDDSDASSCSDFSDDDDLSI